MTFGSENNRHFNIELHINTSDKDPFLRLSYTVKLNSGNLNQIDYVVQLVKVPTNLGNSFRYYFVCPYNGRRCTALYMAYGSHYFKDRLAYEFPIYYPCQIESKTSLAYRYHDINKKLDELYEKSSKHHYNGKETKLGIRIKKLEKKCELFYGIVNDRIEKSLRRLEALI